MLLKKVQMSVRWLWEKSAGPVCLVILKQGLSQYDIIIPNAGWLQDTARLKSAMGAVFRFGMPLE